MVSSTVPKINISFLWHQHQPYYKSDNEFLLPWVRFHSYKDYYDMVKILDDFPKIKQNINLTPSLLIQLDEYLNYGVKDRTWILSNKDPKDLTDEEKKEILINFFKCNTDRMIKPYPRYWDLYRKRGENYDNKLFLEVKNLFSDQDYFDLQVLYNFVWIGEYSKYSNPFNQILEKGKYFNDDDKRIVLFEAQKILKNVLKKHQEVSERDQVEISFSPFYHPILPLLCDTNIAKKTSQNTTLPSKRFKHPEDADIQIKKSVQLYKKLFNKKLIGMWPSEGSLSEESLNLMVRNGIRWTASDEMVLYNSLKNNKDPNVIYRPYEFKTKSGNIKIVFRDHSLSDLIGLVYHIWSPDDAAKDMVNRIHNIRENILKKQGVESLENSLINIILDGENCWEYYKNNGKDFLQKFYSLLSNDDLINTTTIGDFVLNKSPNSKVKRTEKLSTFAPGSWINGNMKIWIGHDEDNKSWDLLSTTRNFLVKEQRKKKHDRNLIAKAWEEIYIAEGSDWNWWYGNDHPTNEINQFDYLFRKHLINVYELLGFPAPQELRKSIKTIDDKISLIQPERFISPIIDGKRSSLTEWQKSGYFETFDIEDANEKVANFIKQIYFGYDYDNLYLRINIDSHLENDFSFIIHFLEPFEINFNINPTGCNINWLKDSRVKPFIFNFAVAFKDFLEISISRKDFNLYENSFVAFEILVYQNEVEVARIPKNSLIRFKLESESDLKNKKKHLILPIKKNKLD